MTKAKTLQQRRSQRKQIEDSKKTLQEQLALLSDALENAPDELFGDDVVSKETGEAETPDAIEKHYSPEYEFERVVGPTSFEELDAAQAAQETAREISTAGWDAQMLVRNIINHPMLGAKEKASAMKGVGDGFEKRVTHLLSSDHMKKDLDQLSVEVVLAHDNRNLSVLGKLGDWISKNILSGAVQENLPDSDFALVKDVNGKKVRKYPVHDVAHARNSLARAAQEMQAGGNAAIDAKEALPKIRSVAKKFGIDMSMKKDRNAIIVQKDESGSWRWIGWASNNFIDTDGDILAEVAHKEFVEYLDKNPQMAPVFLNWHTPDTMRKSLPDFWTYENGFLIYSGPLTEGEAESLMKAALVTDIGMSHQSLVLARDPIDRHVVTKYRMYEVSDLPLKNAANPFTALDTISKENIMNSEEKLNYLAQFVGKERAAELVGQTAAAQKSLTDAGVLSKETAPAKTQSAEAETDLVPEPVMKEIMTKLGMTELSEFVAKAQEAIEKVPMLESALKERSKSQDEQLAEKITPPIATLAWMQKNRSSEKTDNLVGDEDPLKKSKPETGWLSEATNTQPIPASV